MSDEDRLELVEGRCDVETVERLRQSYGEEGDRMSDIERIELLDGLPASGRSVGLARELCRVLGDPALREENDSLRRQLRGAVDALRAADLLADAVMDGLNDVALIGLVREYRAALATVGGQYETPAASDEEEAP